MKLRAAKKIFRQGPRNTRWRAACRKVKPLGWRAWFVRGTTRFTIVIPKALFWSAVADGWRKA